MRKNCDRITILSLHLEDLFFQALLTNIRPQLRVAVTNAYRERLAG